MSPILMGSHMKICLLLHATPCCLPSFPPPFLPVLLSAEDARIFYDSWTLACHRHRARTTTMPEVDAWLSLLHCAVQLSFFPVLQSHKEICHPSYGTPYTCSWSVRHPSTSQFRCLAETCSWYLTVSQEIGHTPTVKPSSLGSEIRTAETTNP